MPVMERHAQKVQKVRTTLRMPKALYEEAQEFVRKSETSVSTINDFFITAICAYVKLMKRRKIDAEFARMAQDVDYQKDVRLMTEEFNQSDWEALASMEEEEDTVR